MTRNGPSCLGPFGSVCCYSIRVTGYTFSFFVFRDYLGSVQNYSIFRPPSKYFHGVASSVTSCLSVCLSVCLSDRLFENRQCFGSSRTMHSDVRWAKIEGNMSEYPFVPFFSFSYSFIFFPIISLILTHSLTLSFTWESLENHLGIT